MAVYNKPQIQILNSDNLVYRDIPYTLQFKITKPTLLEDITEDVNFSDKINLNDTHEEFTYLINKNEWTYTNNRVNITSMSITGDNDDILQITGDKILNYTYKIYFNNEIKKEISEPIIDEEISDKIEIMDNMFNNFVDGIIKIEVYYGCNESLIEVKEYKLQLINTAPTILIGDVVNNKLDITITDAESDQIRINIKLNGKDYFPQKGGFSELLSTPYFYTTNLNSDEINVNPSDFTTPNNVITITVQDVYGAETQLHKSFVGEFYGLMFIDENGEFLSTDSGDYTDDKNILKEFYLGNIKAGTMSDKKIVYLYNKTRSVLTNIELILNTEGIPPKTYIKISKDNLSNFNEMQDKINFGKLQLGVNKTLPFYIQGNTAILSQGGGYFYIDVIADAI